MKKTLVAGALILVGAGGAGVFWNLREAARLSPAELVPAEAVLLAEFPDLPQTALRWQGTALHAILAEPEVRAFFSRPVAEMSPGGPWADAVERFKRVRPRQAFFAVASLADQQPQAVAGFEFSGDRREIEPLISRAMIRAQNAAPQGRLRHLHYRGCRILFFEGKEVSLAGCFAGNWYFVANNVDLLKATLDRHAGKSHTLLAYSAPYLLSRRELPPNGDFRLFIQPPVATSRLLAKMPARPAASPFTAPVAAGAKFQSAALSARIEGRNFHDTLVIRQSAPPSRVPLLNGRTLALTSADTVFYGAFAPQLESWFSGGAPGGGLSGKLIPTLLAALAPTPGPSLARFQAAFGPEHAFLLEWPRPNPQPGLFVASQIRDPAQARRFTEAFFHSWERADADGVPMWSVSGAQPALFHPAVALTGSHLVAGLSSESLKPFARHAVGNGKPETAGATLERSGAFRTAFVPLSKPETALAYLDAAALFDRLYAALRPAAIIWGPGVAWLNRYADFQRLPSAGAVTKHLTPISLTAHPGESGIVIDTSGPVSFVELGVGLGTGAFYAALPSLRPRGPNPPAISPPPSVKPLSAPAEP